VAIPDFVHPELKCSISELYAKLMASNSQACEVIYPPEPVLAIGNDKFWALNKKVIIIYFK